MAKSKTTLRDEQRDVTRRALIKWSLAAGAALGVSRSKIYEILNDAAGPGVAYAASADTATTLCLGIEDGNGGLAHYSLWFPHEGIVKDTGNANRSLFMPGTETVVKGTNGRNHVISACAPMAKVAPEQQWSTFVCGQNQTHTNVASSTSSLGANGLFASLASLQATDSSVIPVVALNGTSLGTAPGAPTAVGASDGDGIVTLFNSAASQAGGLLAKLGADGTSHPDADQYAAAVKAYAALNKVTSTTAASYRTGFGAANLLGTNLSLKLAVTPADLTRYGVGAGTPNNILAMARAMIVTAKAFSLGLTRMVLLPGMRNDPHQLFDSGNVATVMPTMKGVFDGFYNDCVAALGPNGKPIASNLTMVIQGDTRKDPRDNQGWGDGSQDGSNLMLLWSGGAIKSGPYGDYPATGKCAGFDANGAPVATYDPVGTAKIAAVAAAYSIAKADDRAIQTLAAGTALGDGMKNPKQL
jgi:hypothetical protein